jgi:gamma-glutamylcyclotransferase (GGCT)/AIG2-like uncharacterized protein YtfP
VPSARIAYFAYGANMAAAVMAEHCPDHILVGPAELSDHELAFTRRSIRTGTGVADVIPRPGSSVWGVVYELDDAEFARLDLKEGAGWAYERYPVNVRLVGRADPTPAVAYRVRRPEPVAVEPSDEYLAGLVAAARERGLPAAYVEGLDRAAR